MKKIGRLTLKELGENFTEIPQAIQEKINGGDDEVTVTFDRSDGMIYVYGNGMLIGSYPAGNNTCCGYNQWPDGTYNMYDPGHPYGGNSYGGSMGYAGGYATSDFYDNASCSMRTGMAIHSGRYDNVNYSTYGCVRTTAEGVDAIYCATQSYGSFTTFTVRE